MCPSLWGIHPTASSPLGEMRPHTVSPTRDWDALRLGGGAESWLRNARAALESGATTNGLTRLPFSAGPDWACPSRPSALAAAPLRSLLLRDWQTLHGTRAPHSSWWPFWTLSRVTQPVVTGGPGPAVVMCRKPTRSEILIYPDTRMTLSPSVVSESTGALTAGVRLVSSGARSDWALSSSTFRLSLCGVLVCRGTTLPLSGHLFLWNRRAGGHCAGRTEGTGEHGAVIAVARCTLREPKPSARTRVLSCPE